MLTERCVISLLADEAKPSNAPNQDAGLLFYEVQPASTVRSSFKKCSVRVNCLAASSTHAFAAQAGKAVIHVYNLDKGSQEAIVPFPEPISSLALIGPQDSPGILAIGFKNGSIRLWEVCRLILPPDGADQIPVVMHWPSSVHSSLPFRFSEVSCCGCYLQLPAIRIRRFEYPCLVDTSIAIIFFGRQSWVSEWCLPCAPKNLL